MEVLGSTLGREPRSLCAWVLEIGIVRVLGGVRLPGDRHRAGAGRSPIEGGRHRVGETFDIKTCCSDAILCASA